MRKKFSIVPVIVLFSGLALAGTTYQDLDADQDGMISAEEAQKQPELAAKFQDLDKNQDNQLDAAEFAQFEMEPAAGQEGGMGMEETPAE